MLTTERARRRADGLRVADGPSGLVVVHGWLHAHVERVALPRSAVEVVPLLPATGLLVGALAVALFGGLGIVGLGVVAVAADIALRRSAPRRRAAASERALPVVLDAVARHLRAGGSLAQAITAARPPGAAPDLERSWSRLVDLVPVVGVTAALDDWATTAGAGDGSTGRSIRLAAAALSLSATTGGSPARAIDGVAATLRSRLAVADEVRALSSQARASAAVIALAPVGFGVLAAATDARTREFLGTATGFALVAAGLSLDAVGAWWMGRLCRPPATIA